MFRVLKYNHIAAKGLEKFSPEHYQISEDSNQAHEAIILRSQKLHDCPIADGVEVIARAGAGTNNIPIEAMSARGIPVLNTPGANANAVKELVITGMLLACRHICQAWAFANTLEGDNEHLNQLVEKNKKRFSGIELPGRTLGLIGLGHIGIKVANTAVDLGMKVIGFDPAISVKNAWQLSSKVQQAHSLDEVIKHSDFISLHVPYNEHTHHLIDVRLLSLMKPGSTLLNFSRGGIVDNEALSQALEKRLRCYVTDFVDANLKQYDNVISLPHLGASTIEAEENCAIMAAEQIQAFLETGTIKHSVNFPDCHMSLSKHPRLAIANQNIPNMVAQITSCLSSEGINIIDFINKSRHALAYNLLDLDQEPSAALLNKLRAITGVLRVRAIKPAAPPY